MGKDVGWMAGKEMRPKYCRAEKGALGPSDTALWFLKQDQITPPVLFLYSLYTCVGFLYSSLLVLRIFATIQECCCCAHSTWTQRQAVLCSRFLLPQFSLLYAKLSILLQQQIVCAEVLGLLVVCCFPKRISSLKLLRVLSRLPLYFLPLPALVV